MPSNFTTNSNDLDNVFLQRQYTIFDTNQTTFSANGNLYGFGFNSLGNLADGTVINRSSPVQIGSLSDWKEISDGSQFALATKTDGTLWGWGSNYGGLLAIGFEGGIYSSPIQISSLNNWKFIFAGTNTGFAIKTDDSLWAWGQNVDGGRGDNDLINAFVNPTQIGTLTDWKEVSSSGRHTLATKTDGTLWAWGFNTNGQLGQNNRTHRSSPIQIGALTDWKLASAGLYMSAAIAQDGGLWTWGFNYDGQLGQNDRVHRSSPIQVGALTNWRDVSTGTYHNTAIKTDGTLWAWGNNIQGQLGLGDTVHRSSPVQVGALTDWKLVRSGQSHAVALKTSGTLWSMGINTEGQLGRGASTVKRSSPTQIGSLNTWRNVSVGPGSATSLAVLNSQLPS